MNESYFTSEIWLPEPVGQIFSFFRDARNLTGGPIEMREGALIDYRLSLRGIPLRWRSRIEVWEPPRRFIDIQIKGPYRRWHHEHVFESRDNGTLCIDHVRYAVLGGLLADRLFVRRDVEKIFAFRRKRLLALFQGRIQT